MSDQYIYGQVCSRWAGLAVSLDLHKLVPALAPTESRHGYRDHHTFTTHSEHSLLIVICQYLCKLVFITSGKSATSSPSDRALLRSVLCAWARHRPRLFTLPRLLAALRRLGLAGAEAWLRLLTSPYHARIGHEVYRILYIIDNIYNNYRSGLWPRRSPNMSSSRSRRGELLW